MTDIIHKPRAVLGCDPSLGGFAYALAINGEVTLERRIKSKPAESVRGRIDRYIGIVRQIVEDVRGCEIGTCMIEGYSFGSPKAGGRGAIDRAELGGILRLKLLPHCGEIIEVPPTTLKKFACGRGNADKSEVVSALARRFDRHFTTDDQADAFGLVEMALCFSGWREPVNKAQAEVIANMRKKILAEADAAE